MFLPKLNLTSTIKYTTVNGSVQPICMHIHLSSVSGESVL